MSEDELDRWAAIYHANPHLARAGVDYGDLLDDPGVLFSTLPAPEPDGPRPLLPAQRRIAADTLREHQRWQVAQAVEARLPDHAGLCGKRFMERMTHHSFVNSREFSSLSRPRR